MKSSTADCRSDQGVDGPGCQPRNLASSTTSALPPPANPPRRASAGDWPWPGALAGASGWFGGCPCRTVRDSLVNRWRGLTAISTRRPLHRPLRPVGAAAPLRFFYSRPGLDSRQAEPHEVVPERPAGMYRDADRAFREVRVPAPATRAAEGSLRGPSGSAAGVSSIVARGHNNPSTTPTRSRACRTDPRHSAASASGTEMVSCRPNCRGTRRTRPGAPRRLRSCIGSCSPRGRRTPTPPPSADGWPSPPRLATRA